MLSADLGWLDTSMDIEQEQCPFTSPLPQIILGKSHREESEVLEYIVCQSLCVEMIENLEDGKM